jgi:hypothetical protein
MWGLCVGLLGPDVSPSRFTATSPAGNIYDLGYRHYEGKRNGRAYAMWSLFVESFRGIWGFGRPTTAKVALFLLLLVPTLALFVGDVFFILDLGRG